MEDGKTMDVIGNQISPTSQEVADNSSGVIGNQVSPSSKKKVIKKSSNVQNSLLNKFDTPAFQGEKDFKNQPVELENKFLLAWSNYVTYCTQNSQIGNPWTSLYDNPRSWYFNPINEPLYSPSADNTVPIQWTAFPNRVNFYFGSLFNQKFGADATDRLHELADIGPTAFTQKYDIELLVPKNGCDPQSPVTRAFGPMGPRGWQDEYTEWSVIRDAKGNITTVDFTHENPEYWFHLWRVNPNLVLSLYQEILGHTNVKLEDLYLLDEDSEPVIVRETGNYAYNPINKWNCGTSVTPTSGGAIHLTSPPNSLGAEIYLGAAATILREVNGVVITDANALICAAQYGQIHRNSDPRIGQSVNLLVQKNNVQVSLTNPIALYGQVPDFSMFIIPANANKTIQDCYSIVRGLSTTTGTDYYPNNMILHSRFTIPEGANFTMKDIKINGAPIQWGSQIADTFKVQLAGTGILPKVGQQKQIFPPVADQNPGLPNLQYLLDYSLLEASLYNNLDSLSNLTSCITQVEVNSSTSNIAILTSGANQTTQFSFGDGISVVVNSFQDLGDQGELFVVTLIVNSSTSIGEKPFSLSNKATDPQFPVRGVLEVVPAGTLPPVKQNSTNNANLSSEKIQYLKTIL